MDEKPNFDEILNKRLKQESSLSKDYSLELDENNTFKYVNLECPKCSSHKIIKKGTITKEKQNILGKTVEFKEQQYQCKNCNKKFGINYAFIESVITGSKGTYQLSIPFLIVLFICFPLQSIAEEYAFRGFIMQTLGSWFNIPVLALILQAVIFALGHDYNSIGLVEMVVAGIILGFFAWKTNGIEVSSAMHTASNFSVGLSVMLGLRTSTSTPQLYSVLATIVLEIVLLIIMYYVGKKTNWFGEIPENY